MPINYSFQNGNAVLETDNPVAREMNEYMAGFQRPAQTSSRGKKGGMAKSKVNKPNDRLADRQRLAQMNVASEEARARIAAARAISDPAPMRSIRGGPGMIGGVGRSGLQLDTAGMTGAQRAALLPQGAGMGAIGPSGASLAASTIQPPPQMPQGDDWYSLPDHVRKALLIQQGWGS